MKNKEALQSTEVTAKRLNESLPRGFPWHLDQLLNLAVLSFPRVKWGILLYRVVKARYITCVWVSPKGLFNSSPAGLKSAYDLSSLAETGHLAQLNTLLSQLFLLGLV